MPSTATIAAPQQASRSQVVIFDNTYDLHQAKTNFRRFASGRAINELVTQNKLIGAVRGDEFPIFNAPGQELGKRIEFDGFTYAVPKRYQKLVDTAIVLSFSTVKISKGGHVSGEILGTPTIPQKNGWYKVSQDELCLPNGEESSASDPTARYWYRTDGAYIGAVVRGGDDFFDGRGVGANFVSGCAFRVASLQRNEPEPAGKQATTPASIHLVDQLRDLTRQSQGITRELRSLLRRAKALGIK